MKLFLREEPVTKFVAVEKLNLLYNFLTTVLIIIFYNRLDSPQSMLLGRFLILAGTFAIIFLYTKFPSRATVFLRVLFQMSLLSYWYPDTFEFNRIFPNLDHLFASMDFSLFGCQPAIEFEKVCGSLFWREAFNMG